MQNRDVPLRDVIEAIVVMRFKNPARARSVNLLEPERGTREHYDPFDPRCKDRIFAAVVNAFQAAKRYSKPKETEAFLFCCVGGVDVAPISCREYGRRIGVNASTVSRRMKKFRECFERELVQRGVIEEQETEEHKYKNARANYEKDRPQREAKKKADLRRKRDGETNRTVYRSE